jgi:hypothetical protein
MKKIFFIALIAIFLGCGSRSNNGTSAGAGNPPQKKEPIQLNISILLDLSDRVIQPMQPTQPERDIEIVSILLDIFKKTMETKGAFQANDKIQILFNPAPSDPNINNIAKKLSVDLSKLKPVEKKQVFDSIEKDFEHGLKTIYDLTLQTKKWVGSDIWRFFKSDVKDLCIKQDTNYRNILVIITDGYLYHEQSKDRQKNRTAYITPTYLQNEGFRNPNWQNKFNEKDYGLIFSGQTYENLEIMVLEVNPSAKFKNDEDVIKAFLVKWFDEMKIKNYEIYHTDLPQNTKTRIDGFFK